MNKRQQAYRAMFSSLPTYRLADITDEMLAGMGFVEPYRHDIILDLRYEIIEDLRKNGPDSHFFTFRVEDYFDSAPVEQIVRQYLSSNWYSKKGLIRYHVFGVNPILTKIMNTYFSVKFKFMWFWVHTVKGCRNPYMQFKYRQLFDYNSH